jgi:hypothetical protein
MLVSCPVLTRPATSVVLGALALTLAACGGSDSTGGSSGSGATTIDLAAVETGVDEMSSFIAICSNAAGEATADASQDCGPGVLARLLQLRREPALRGSYASFALTGARPSDMLGSCGGRARYLDDYSHSSGTTTGTFAFENYCESGDDGERLELDGRVTFRNVGTPTATGPITNRVEASSPAGITQTVRDAGGQLQASQRIAFTNYVFVPGEAGATATAAKPDVATADEIRITNLITSKTYRQTDYRLSTFVNASGGEQLTLAGRGYRSDGTYFNVTTAQPVISNADGDFVAGQLAFGGKDNSRAVLTVVPGPVLQGTVTVNGQPVTNAPPCRQ